MYHTLQKLALFWKVNNSNVYWKGKTEIYKFYHILRLFVRLIFFWSDSILHVYYRYCVILIDGSLIRRAHAYGRKQISLFKKRNDDALVEHSWGLLYAECLCRESVMEKKLDSIFQTGLCSSPVHISIASFLQVRKTWSYY